MVFARGLGAWAPGLVYVAYDSALALLVFALTASRRRGVPERAAARPTLAVIVTAHDEADVLPLTLRALLAQTDAPDLVVIADDGSRDATASRLARDFALVSAPPCAMATSAAHPRLRWLRLPHGGKPGALNAALSAIDADIVVTVDADTLLDVAAIGLIREAFEAEANLVATCGTLVPTCAATPLGRWLQGGQQREYQRNALFFAAWARMGALLHIPGAFAAYRRDALLAVGGFDPDALVEDYELIHRLRRYAALHALGWTTGALAARATTDAPADVMAFLRQRRRWFSGFLETQFRYRDMVGAGRYGRVGRIMLPIKAFDTLQPLHGLAALALLPVLALRGDWRVLLAAGALLASKAMIEAVLQRRAARDGGLSATPLAAFGTTIADQFSFAILRHLGAALGWLAFLTGDRRWRTGTRSTPAEAPR